MISFVFVVMNELCKMNHTLDQEIKISSKYANKDKHTLGFRKNSLIFSELILL